MRRSVSVLAALAAAVLALLLALWPGEYELWWYVHHAGTGAAFPVRLSEAQTIHVPEPPASPRIDAWLTRDAVAQAVLEAGG